MDFHKIWRPFLFGLAGLAVYAYLLWRLFYTLPQGYALIFGMVLLSSEWMQAFQTTNFYWLLYKPNKKEPPAIPEELYTVDVLVATYNESVDVLKRTVTACTNLDYPNDLLKITICDDGNRREVKELALELGVHYIARMDNKHAKAGNLNHAMRHTKGQLMVTLDADMIPKPSFLKRTVGFFKDPDFAFVQVPQSFYNSDIFQHNILQGRNIPNEQDMFMRTIQSGRDRFNAAIYIGSNTVFRRSALEAIGGFATGTITEDLATGMLLQAQGYKTAYLNEILAQGLATESLQDFLKQRIRWARGTIQTFKKWNPLLIPGLSPMQRLLYLSSVIYWYHGLFKVVFILSPLVYLLLGMPVLNASFQGLLIFWLPQYFLSALVLRVFSSNIRTAFWSHLYETVTAPLLLWEVFKETTGIHPIGFSVTPKNIVINRVYFHWRAVLPHIILIILSLGGIFRGIYLLEFTPIYSSVLINLFWLFYNLIGLVGSLVVATEQPRVRKTERFARSYPAQVSYEMGNPSSQGSTISGETIDVSENGCKLFIREVVRVKDKIRIVISGTRDFEFHGKVVYFDTFKEGYQLAVEFEKNIALADFKDWILEIYGQEVDESTFRVQPKSRNPVNIFSQYLSRFKIRHTKTLRKSPRVSTRLACKLHPVSAYSLGWMEAAAASEVSYTLDTNTRLPRLTNAELVNVSFGGCQIQIRASEFSYAKEDMLLIRVQGFEQDFFGRVVSTTQIKNNLFIGLKWTEDSVGFMLMERYSSLSMKLRSIS